MKIHYRQAKDDEAGALLWLGVRDCYLKQLTLGSNRDHISKASHYHTSFECHMVREGYQEYEIEGETYRLDSGSYLLIGPNVSHKAVAAGAQTVKYSITFNRSAAEGKPAYLGRVPERVWQNLDFIAGEAAGTKEMSRVLTENSLLEILVCLFRLIGLKESDREVQEGEHAVLSMARQYIEDNVATAPSVADVASYCYLSTKQLTRLFHKFEEISPGGYIIRRRIKKIETLLADPALTLKQISTMMNFDNEYYFNAYFKKYSGMPPGEYRRMLGQ